MVLKGISKTLTVSIATHAELLELKKKTHLSIHDQIKKWLEEEREKGKERLGHSRLPAREKGVTGKRKSRPRHTKTSSEEPGGLPDLPIGKKRTGKKKGRSGDRVSQGKRVGGKVKKVPASLEEMKSMSPEEVKGLELEEVVEKVGTRQMGAS